GRLARFDSPRIAGEFYVDRREKSLSPRTKKNRGRILLKVYKHSQSAQMRRRKHFRGSRIRGLFAVAFLMIAPLMARGNGNRFGSKDISIELRSIGPGGLVAVLTSHRKGVDYAVVDLFYFGELPGEGYTTQLLHKELTVKLVKGVGVMSEPIPVSVDQVKFVRVSQLRVAASREFRIDPGQNSFDSQKNLKAVPGKAAKQVL
ncbi:MAG TPA: hypothetical protein VLI55_16080, partial [Bryobacteraceae bacterium]|nr:hypothetical protein [Bryobacteraceae bacterium]